MTMTISGTGGVTFPDSSNQNKSALVAGGTIASGTVTTLTSTTLSDGTNSTSSTNCIQGSAKAWVNFVGNNPATVNASYNVSSVTFVSTGFYQINFTNAFADSKYSIVGSCSNNGVSANLFQPSSAANKTTSSCRAESLNANNGSSVSVNEIDVAVFR